MTTNWIASIHAAAVPAIPQMDPALLCRRLTLILAAGFTEHTGWPFAFVLLLARCAICCGR